MSGNDRHIGSLSCSNHASLARVSRLAAVIAGCSGLAGCRPARVRATRRRRPRPVSASSLPPRTSEASVATTTMAPPSEALLTSTSSPSATSSSAPSPGSEAAVVELSVGMAERALLDALRDPDDEMAVALDRGVDRTRVGGTRRTGRSLPAWCRCGPGAGAERVDAVDSDVGVDRVLRRRATALGGRRLHVDGDVLRAPSGCWREEEVVVVDESPAAARFVEAFALIDRQWKSREPSRSRLLLGRYVMSRKLIGLVAVTAAGSALYVTAASASQPVPDGVEIVATTAEVAGGDQGGGGGGDGGGGGGSTAAPPGGAKCNAPFTPRTMPVNQELTVEIPVPDPEGFENAEPTRHPMEASPTGAAR